MSASITTSNDEFARGIAARSHASLCSPAISIAIASAVVASLVLVGGSGRLPALGWVAAYLFIAVESDVRELRIPNWLNFGALAAALVGAALGTEALSLGAALSGTGLAFALLFPAFAMGWLGAGDVKAAMVLGALFGTSALLGLLWWSFVAGGLIGLGMVAARGELPGMLRRWWITLRSLSCGVWAPLGPKGGTAAASGLPFALALAVGVLSFDLWGVPWL